MSADKCIRFLLCEPAKHSQTGSDVFMFNGEYFNALAIFSSLKAFNDYKEYYSKHTEKKLAKVIFHNAEKIGSKHPHTFIGWMEVQPSPPPE